MEFKNYYDYMGVSSDAPISVIKSKYREMAAKLHPDVTNDEEPFKYLQQVYTTLIDKIKREKYNQSLIQKEHPIVNVNFSINDLYIGGEKRFIFKNEDGESIGLFLKLYKRKIPNNVLYKYKDSKNQVKNVEVICKVISKLTTLLFEIIAEGLDVKVKVLTRTETPIIFIPELKIEFNNNKQIIVLENYGLRTDDLNGNLIIDNSINIIDAEHTLV